MTAGTHPDDEFHPPSTDDPFWTETCWFTFAVPGRRLSAQLYPFFRPNQGVCAAAAYAWDDTGDQPWNARYAKNVPGRKTDISDAAWLRQLHSYGPLRGSFRPGAEFATLRAYLGQRERLVEYAAAH